MNKNFVPLIILGAICVVAVVLIFRITGDSPAPVVNQLPACEWTDFSIHEKVKYLDKEWSVSSYKYYRSGELDAMNQDDIIKIELKEVK